VTILRHDLKGASESWLPPILSERDRSKMNNAAKNEVSFIRPLLFTPTRSGEAVPTLASAAARDQHSR